LTGAGQTAAALTFSGGPPAYGTVTTGQSKTQTFTLTNGGQAMATAMSLNTLSAPFSVDAAGTTCGTSLAGNNTACNLAITYSPTAATTSNVTLTMSYDDGTVTSGTNQTAQQAIQGTGQFPECAVAVAGDYYIRDSGTVVYYNGSTTEITVGDAGTPLQPVSQVFANAYTGCALRSSDGTVWCWGDFTGSNANGALGNGTFVDNPSYFEATEVEISAPDGGPITYLDNVTSLPTGSTIGSGGIGEAGQCVIRADKTLWCWGNATEGNLWQVTTGSTSSLPFATQMIVPFDGGDGGGVLEGGAAFQNVDQVSMGERHACYTSAGQVYCWGANVSGNLGTGDTTAQAAPFNVVTGLPDAGTVESVNAGSPTAGAPMSTPGTATRTFRPEVAT
jgi:hypothetical protein